MTDTATRLLDEAQRLVQTRGFNAFSYRDLEDAVGIRTASIHYHFRSKADLGAAMMSRYLDRLRAQLDAIEAESPDDPAARLRAFVEVYRATQRAGVICLCGALASDIATLPEPMQSHIADYLASSEAWVAAQIDAGVASGAFRQTLSAADLATTLVAGLQGALILGRAMDMSPGASSHLERLERTFFAALVPDSDPN